MKKRKPKGTHECELARQYAESFVDRELDYIRRVAFIAGYRAARRAPRSRASRRSKR